MFQHAKVLFVYICCTAFVRLNLVSSPFRVSIIICCYTCFTSLVTVAFYHFHLHLHRSTCSSTRQRRFDLRLILRAQPHSPQAFWKRQAQLATFCQRTAQQGQTATPRTPCPTLFEQCVGSLTSRKIMNNEELRDGAYGLSFLSKKTRKSNHLQMQLQRQQFLLSYLKTLTVGLARV